MAHTKNQASFLRRTAIFFSVALAFTSAGIAAAEAEPKREDPPEAQRKAVAERLEAIEAAMQAKGVSWEAGVTRFSHGRRS